MTYWMIAALGDDRKKSLGFAVGEDLLADLGLDQSEWSAENRFTATGYELAVHSLLDQSEPSDQLREVSELAFEAARASGPATEDSDARLTHLLHTSCFGVLADRTPDVSRYLKVNQLLSVDGDDADWGVRVRRAAYRLWILVLRKDGWADLDTVLVEIAALRELQSTAEEGFLNLSDTSRGDAWRLIALYHLSKAAELLATYSAQGSVSGGFNIREQLQAQFDRSVLACERGEILDLHETVRLLAATSERMVANSIWSITRSAGGRVQRFVESMAARTRERPVFELLPPQRITLRDQGLMTSGARAVVLSLPTSSGKTFIAQFRILQALNQFEDEKGWVAYIAPTRALVNQVCARLRRDFAPLGVAVERVSPAMEIDGAEADILSDTDPRSAFRVLVGTPEKIDLLLRGGWEAKIGRPLTLVVVDEAHNLASDSRGLRLELLLATINRECRNSQFLLLTPFIENRAEIARWLSPDSHADMAVEFNWRPNDRAVVLACPHKGARIGEFEITLETLHTTRSTIEIDKTVPLCSGKELGLTWSQVKSSLSNIAAATASCLNKRGPVIVVAQKVKDSWSIARTISSDPNLPKRLAERQSGDEGRIRFVADYVREEFGADFELVQLLEKRIGLHHTGLSDDTRVLMEWLMECGELDTLVATTTIAQGLNFPVTAVVLASHQYPYGQDMPAEDFWNLAGRVGRADQSGTGVVALAANSSARAEVLAGYVKKNVSKLNSSLVGMVHAALSRGAQLELHTLYYIKEWSAFLQYLAHSYRQVGDHAEFASQVEQVLRGSFGFQRLRSEDQDSANRLVEAVQDYASVIRNQPLSLVDSTGFSWESVQLALASANNARLRADSWDASSLFSDRDRTLKDVFGVLLRIPELRDELAEVTGGGRGDGDLLARIVKDWVNGASLHDMADEHFKTSGDSSTSAMSKACRLIFGRMTSTASWGISAIQSLTVGDAVNNMSEEERRTFRNLPSRVYYGVNSDRAIDLRLLGVPRNAAQPLSDYLAGKEVEGNFKSMRQALTRMTTSDWSAAMGRSGATYEKVWRVLEGFS